MDVLGILEHLAAGACAVGRGAGAKESDAHPAVSWQLTRILERLAADSDVGAVADERTTLIRSTLD